MTSSTKFVERGGIKALRISTPWSECEIFPENGAQVASFVPKGYGDILWMSADSRFEKGVAARGGIPICWPWFGPHPTDESLPNHGFARSAEWTLERIDIKGDTGVVSVLMSLTPSDKTRSMWPHSFRLEYLVTVGKTLKCVLTTTNLDETPMELTQALHTYFRVGEIGRASVEGLDGVEYIDTLDGYKRKIQKGPITFEGNVDSVYVSSVGDRALRDESENRVVTIVKSGSASDVVWNPWDEKAAEMDDFADDGYRTMVCLETSNAFDDKRVIPPGESHAISAEFSVAD